MKTMLSLQRTSTCRVECFYRDCGPVVVCRMYRVGALGIPCSL